MYRRTKKYAAARQEAMQRGRSQSRMDQPAPDYPAELPQVRMRITVERFDLAQPERHEFELRKTNRVDVYAVLVDGQPWKHAGLTAVLEGLRKAAAETLAKDADRYKMLRRGQKWSVIDGIGDTLRGDALDAAIDAAIESYNAKGEQQ